MRLICLHVDPHSRRVLIPASGHMMLDVPAADATTGHVVRHFQRLMPEALLMLAGDSVWYKAAAKVVCCITAPPAASGAIPWTLGELADHPLYAAASLALAKVAANSGGHTTLGQIIPLLSGNSGKRASAPMALPDLLKQGKSITREQALHECHYIEAQ